MSILLIDSVFASCLGSFSRHGGVFMGFFMGGLAGGFTHCLGMCGPLVSSETISCQSGCKSACSQKAQRRVDMVRVSGLSYHLGRATTYGALGFFAALFSRQLSALAIWPFLSSAMLFGAGLLFLLSALSNCKHANFFKPSGKIAYFRGVLLGFIPCGLLYAALMMAATLIDPLSGMLAMWMFVLGTIPALLIASMGAEFLTRKWPNGVGKEVGKELVIQRFGRAMMAFNGVALLVVAARGHL